MEPRTEQNLKGVLAFLKEHEVFMFLNSNIAKQTFADQHSFFDWMLAAGAKDELINDKNSFDSLKSFHDKNKSWLFGALSYDLKNETEQLTSSNHDGIRASEMHFFSPEYLFVSKGNKVEVKKGDWSVVDSFMEHVNGRDHMFDINLQQRVSKEQYITNVNSIKEHIHRGDIYEMNYCMEFYAEDAVIDPYKTYLHISEVSPSPFSSFYRNRNIYLISASPERFLKKEGDSIISQPMKGTAKRGATVEEDMQMKARLEKDPKEQSENVMIVDLVRNDLSKHAKRGTVKVEELFGTYTFPQVHQMISTVSGKLKQKAHFTDVIKDAFPMGSMTGAPKVSAMQLIEQYEKTKRGIYSGAVGYITPEGNFDFNVIIRSIIYNSKTKYLSFMVGSAITAASDPEREYEECLLKAKAMTDALQLKLKVNHDPA